MKAKIILCCLIVVGMTLMYLFPLNVPAGDRAFARGLLVVAGLVCVALVATAEVFYCPKCGADTGHFRGKLNGRVTRQGTMICKKCGHQMNAYGRPWKR